MMASACFERAGFIPYERDWIDYVSDGILISKGRKEQAPQSSLDEVKSVHVFCECRAESIDSAGGPQPKAASAKSSRRMWESTVFQRRRDDSRWSSLSRRRSLGEGSSKVLGVALMAREGDAHGMGDLAIGVTSLCASCGEKASKGTCKSGADAVPKMSPGSRSRYPVRRIVCRPEPKRCSEGYWPP